MSLLCEKFHPLMCRECFVAFAILDPHFIMAARFDAEVFCPNGHVNYVVNPKAEAEEPDPAIIEQRRQLGRQIHEQDQAAAKEAEAAKSSRRKRTA